MPTTPAAGLEPPAPPARRILPNLLTTSLQEPEAVPEPAQEPTLPRVRRVKPRAVAVEAVHFAVPVAPARAPVVVEPPPSAVRAVRERREPGLRPGERWKRRLPRACW